MPYMAESLRSGGSMERNKIGFDTIDKYIATFPKEVQKILKGLRNTIKAAAPGADERISYQMPAFSLKGILVYFAAYIARWRSDKRQEFPFNYIRYYCNFLAIHLLKNENYSIFFAKR